MFYLSKPAGGLQIGASLLKPPYVQKYSLGLPVKTLFVSDIHASPDTRQAADNVIEAMKTLSPELILMAGDYAECNDEFLRFFDALSSVKPRYGIFAVEGNNDYTRFKFSHERTKAEVEKSGARLLRDECVTVHTDNGDIEILGARCAYFEETHPEGLFSDREGVYRILLTHEPLISTLDAVDGKANLMLSGHTHGGQVNVLGFTCYEILNYESNLRFTHIAGLKRIHNTDVLVSRGIGTSKYPVRFGARQEIYLLT